MRVDLGEFRRAYVLEVEEHLANASARLLELEQAATHRRPSSKGLRDLMRLLHTIKGLSAMVGVDAVVTITHRMEHAVRSIELANAPPERRIVEALLDGLAAVRSRVDAVAREGSIEPPPEALLAALEPDARPRAVVEAGAPSLGAELDARLGPSEREQVRAALAGHQRIVRIDFAPSSTRAERGVSITSVRKRVEALGEIVKVVPLAQPPSDAAPTGLVFLLVVATRATDDALAEAADGSRVVELVASSSALEPAPSAVGTTVESESPEAADALEAARPTGLRVELERIEDALEKLSSLVVTRARLALAIQSLREAGADTRDLVAIHQETGRHLFELRSAMLRLRMIPVAAVLESLPFMMRGLARATGKDVRLDIGAGSAEIDKIVGEKLLPALVHLLRNAVDHGIETPDERARRGKPAHGTVTIRCAAQGSRVVEVCVDDDGRGIDREAVLAHAGYAPDADDGALLEALCRPGLSTRAEADTTSGRGIGMDIVRKIVVDELGGAVHVQTQRGAGTRFVLRVPLTIAVVEVFTVRCGTERFVVPVPAVEEVLDLTDPTLSRLDTQSARFLSRRGESVPLLDLAATIGLAPAPRDRLRQALLVRRGRDEPIAFAVDRVIGQQEAVVRPLEDAFLNIAGVAGATDLGDGKPTIVLDLAGLFAGLSAKERAA